MAKPHVIMVPFPMQGHVIPLMELAHCLAKHGIKITFVNTEIIHNRIVDSFTENTSDDRIRLVSISDGLKSEERNVPGKLTETLYRDLPHKIEELILEINDSDEGEISCVIYDQSIGSIQQVAKNIGIRSAAFLPAAAALLVLGFKIPELIEDGIIDSQGTPINKQTVQFTTTMPIMNTSDFVWSRVKIMNLQKLIFDIMIQNNKAIKSADQIICNSIYDLEPGAFALAPQILPIGPLLSSNRLENSPGHLWPHDSTCLEWLDQQPSGSVLYIAFGSSVILNQVQFQELALALELINRPFLWVVRPDISTGSGENQTFLDGFLDRVSGRGRIISWAPQQTVLSHASIACFMSHCGWNSTVESVSNGVPLLCWPYFADQFINQSYICDIWKVGLRFEQGGNGIISSEEIKNKVDQLMDDCVFKERALCLKEIILNGAREGGKSYNNFTDFIKWIEE